MKGQTNIRISVTSSSLSLQCHVCLSGQRNLRTPKMHANYSVLGGIHHSSSCPSSYSRPHHTQTTCENRMHILTTLNEEESGESKGWRNKKNLKPNSKQGSQWRAEALNALSWRGSVRISHLKRWF